MATRDTIPPASNTDASGLAMHGPALGIGRIDNPRILARLVRAAYQDALQAPIDDAVPMPTLEVEPTNVAVEDREDYSAVPITNIVTNFNRHPLPSVDELTERLEAYSLEDRLRIMHERPGARMVPFLRREVSDAFRVIYHLEHGKTMGQVIADIGWHQMPDDIGMDTDPAFRDAAIKRATDAMNRVSDNFGAYMRYAGNAKYWLGEAGKAVKGESGHYDNLAQFAIAADMPYHEGLGQLAHYLDVVLVAEGIEGPHINFAFPSKPGKGSNNRSIIKDPYIASEPSKKMRAHREAVLSQINMTDAPSLLKFAEENAGALEQFWNLRLHQAQTDKVAGPAATAALRAS